MSEAEHLETAAAPPDLHALTAALRAAGADRFDPVRMHYIEMLARRAAAHDGGAGRMIAARLEQAAMALSERLEQARSAAADIVSSNAALYPHAAADLQRFLDNGDFKELRRFVSTLQAEAHGPLAALTRQLEQASREEAGARAEQGADTRSELKAIRKFRNTWSRLSADNQVTQALRQAPKNAGPINSHMLVLRSLALMREVSPDYLTRFMSYADALLCLDQGEKEKPVARKKPQAVKAAKNKSA